MFELDSKMNTFVENSTKIESLLQSHAKPLSRAGSQSKLRKSSLTPSGSGSQSKLYCESVDTKFEYRESGVAEPRFQILTTKNCELTSQLMEKCAEFENYRK